MKLSMWMIAERLQKYNPKYDIKNGEARITGVRFFSGEEMAFTEQYVYLGMDAGITSHAHAEEEVVLINGGDIILLQSTNMNNILNDLLAVFDYYNTWESSLWAESAYKSFQRLLDMGDSVLGNPMMISDADGNILAMSSLYRDEDINEYWVEARNTNHVPTAVLGSPMRSPGGSLVRSWTNEAAQYVMPDGTNTIGAVLISEGENVAAFSLWAYRKPINPGNVWLVKVLCSVITSMIGKKEQSAGLRSSSAIISDLLDGTEIDVELIRKLELKCSSPWQLIVIDNPYRSDTFYTRGIVSRLREHTTPSVPLIYRDRAVALVSAEDAQPLLKSILGGNEKQYYLAGLSMPFDDLANITVRYEQTLFTLERAEGNPGIYLSEDCAFEYLLSLTGDKNKRQMLTHPALAKLRRYDIENGGDFYHTLYQYLLNERSILLGSQALHIHRNSFMYRIQRIKALLGIDLDDPMIRNYLLLSYMLDH